MLTNKILPDVLKTFNATLPDGYGRVIQRDMNHIDPWRFIETSEEVNDLFETMTELYPDAVYLPFARRMDNDDIACVVIKNTDYAPNSIVRVHLFASEGYEVDEHFTDFWAWFRTAVNEMVDLLETAS